MIDPDPIFTTSGIRAFFRHLAATYRHFTLKGWDGGPGVILRQDVDLDLGLARAFADVQAQEGLSSTFFVLVTSPCYNPMTPTSRAHLRSLVADGFEVGLHFDPTVDEDPERHHREADLLGGLCGERVASISLHNPTSRGEYPLYHGYLNAYDPRVFSPETYLSDSCFSWRQDPWTFLPRASNNAVQLLFHPCHYSESGLGYPSAFASHLDAYLARVDCSFRPFNATYARQLSPDLKGWFLARESESPLDRSEKAGPE